MMVELSAIWVVVIVLIGIAIGVYSVCKGCQGMREQANATQQLQQNRMTPTAPGAAPQLRSDEINQSQLYLISGATVYDKNPPSYEELIEPPPSYEETIKLQMEQQQSGTQHPQPPPPSLCEGSAHVNLACDVTLSEERDSSGASTSWSPTASSSHQQAESTSASSSSVTEKPPHVGVTIGDA